MTAISKLYTAPTFEPISTSEAKAHLQIEHADDDTMIGTLIAAARKWTEEACWRCWCTQTWDLVLDAFPDEGYIVLPKGGLASITSITYTDEDGDAQTLSGTTAYEADTYSMPGRARLRYGQIWPATRDEWDAVTCRYVVGTDAASVPQPVKQAILMLVAHLYEYRIPEVQGAPPAPVAFAVRALLGPYRLERYS